MLGQTDNNFFRIDVLGVIEGKFIVFPQDKNQGSGKAQSHSNQQITDYYRNNGYDKGSELVMPFFMNLFKNNGFSEFITHHHQNSGQTGVRNHI